MTNVTKNLASETPEPQPEPLLDKLLNFEPVPAPVISLYLDTRVNEQGKRQFMPFVRKQLNERAKSYDTDSLERESFETDFRRIVSYLEDGINTTTNGLVIFACAAADDFFEVGEFETPFERDRLFVSDRPHVFPLANVAEKFRRYAVVLADTNRARIFVFAAGQAVNEESIDNVKTKRTRVGGWSQARYQRHEENYHLHHVKEVVDVLERIVREEEIEHVILAGDETAVIPLLREQLPKALEEKVIDAVNLGIDTPEHELLAESLAVFERHDSLTDMEKVQRLFNEYRGDNLGVAGVPDTLAALSNGQVEEVLILATPENLQYDEEEVKKVLELYDVDGTVPPEINHQVVADEIVRRANLLSSARVTFIEDEMGLEHVGGVGGLLRYRISEENAVPYEDSSAVPRSQALTTQAS